MYAIYVTSSNGTGRAVGGAGVILPAQRSFQGTVVGTGAVTATVKIYGSNHDPVSGVGQYGVLLGTITLSGTTSHTDGFVTNAPWPWVWADVTNLTGTGAQATVTMGA